MMLGENGRSQPPSFLRGGGEVGELLRAFDWRAHPLGDPDGWPSELKGALHFILAAQQPLCIFWGPEHRYFYNDAFLSAFGRELHPTLGADARLLYAEHWAVVGPQVEHVLMGHGGTWREERPIDLVRGGRRERCHFTYGHNPIYQAGAPYDVGGVLVLCQDVTQQVNARGRVLEERRRLLEHFEHAPSLMATLRGPEHRFELANAAFRRLVGNRPLEGRIIYEALSELDEAVLRERLDRTFRSGEALAVEGGTFVFADDSGVREHHIDLVYQPTFDHEGHVDGILVVGHDVTELKRLEQEQARSLDMERRLRSAQRMEAVGRLTGRIAHDFNNILAIILGNAELLVEHLADDELGRPQAELVAQAAERGATMVSRLLAYAQRQHLESNRIEPGSFLQGLIGRLERDLPVNVTVELTVQGTPWPVQIDIGQLEKSLEDLVSNAADAMPDGGIVSVRCDNFTVGQDRALRQAFGLVSRQEVAPGEYVRIVVEDRGHGMSPEVLASAFEPFFTTKDIGKGTGLGLSMVLGFIRQSQGYVGVVSSPGRGTCITLLIPRLVEAPRAEPLAERAFDTSASSSEHASNILVVDDEPAMCRHVVAQLIKAGYRAVGAKDPREALALLAGPERFDLLFTDILMPGGMNGRQLVEEARRHHPALKVLYTSGYTAEALAGRDGAELEADQLLTKPYRKSDLLERVRAALASR